MVLPQMQSNEHYVLDEFCYYTLPLLIVYVRTTILAKNELNLLS